MNEQQVEYTNNRENIQYASYNAIKENAPQF